MASRSVPQLLLAIGALLAGCSSGTPRPAPGRPPAPVAEYWAAPDAQKAFDRISYELATLEVQHAAAAATATPGDQAMVRMTGALLASRVELASLPNPAMSQIVFAGRLDAALDRRLRELAVEQRLLLARVKPEDPEAQRMAAVVAALSGRREALHEQQQTLHAQYRAAPTLSAGEWIRVSLPSQPERGPRRAQGRLLELHQDSLLWKPSGSAPRSLRLPPGATLERVVSRRGHAWEGAVIGLVGAAVIGKIKRSPYDDEGGLRAMLFAPAGALIGGLFGASIYTEEWAPVAWPGGRVVLAPAGTGVGIRWSPPLRSRGP